MTRISRTSAGCAIRLSRHAASRSDSLSTGSRRLTVSELGVLQATMRFLRAIGAARLRYFAVAGRRLSQEVPAGSCVITNLLSLGSGVISGWALRKEGFAPNTR